MRPIPAAEFGENAQLTIPGAASALMPSNRRSVRAFIEASVSATKEFPHGEVDGM